MSSWGVKGRERISTSTASGNRVLRQIEELRMEASRSTTAKLYSTGPDWQCPYGFEQVHEATPGPPSTPGLPGQGSSGPCPVSLSKIGARQGSFRRDQGGGAPRRGDRRPQGAVIPLLRPLGDGENPHRPGLGRHSASCTASRGRPARRGKVGGGRGPAHRGGWGVANSRIWPQSQGAGAGDLCRTPCRALRPLPWTALRKGEARPARTVSSLNL